jgi:hypothetical protein
MKTVVKVEKSSVVFKNNSRIIKVTKNREGNNMIHLKGLTSLVGEEPGAKHFLSEDGLVKNTVVGLTNATILDLTVALMMYVEEVLGTDLKEK